MAEWTTLTLAEICAASGGGIQTGPFGSQLHASDYVADGTPSVMPQNIGDNRISTESIARINDADLARLAKYTLQAGDIVYSRRGDVERRALVREENDGWLCGTGCLRVRIQDQHVYDSRFISYALGLAKSREWIVRHAVGATMLNLNTGILGGVPLRVPGVGQQRAIAQVLGALDDKIAANSRTIATADALAEALTEQTFSGEVVRLADVASVTMGSSPPGTSYNEEANGLPFYQGVRDFGVRFPSRRVWTDAPVRRAVPGDTLLSVRAPVGRTNLAVEEICIGRGLAALRAKNGRAMTLFHQVRAAHAAWAPYEAEGTVFGAINRAQLEGIELPALKADEADHLDARLTGLENVIAGALRESFALETTRDQLMPLLMSGKVHVKDAQNTAEGVL